MYKKLSLVVLVLGVILALASFVLFPICSKLMANGGHMKCWYSGIFVTVMGGVVVLSSLISLTGRLLPLWYIVSGAAALLCWLVPRGIVKVAGDGWACGLCGNPEMACHATAVKVDWIAGAIVLFCVIGLLTSFVRGNR